MSITIKKIGFLFTLLVLSCVNAHASWVPFVLKNNLITIEIEFNGETATAILDTGAEMNAVSNFYVNRFNDGINTSGSVIVKGVGGNLKRDLYSNVPVRMFGVDVNLDNLAGVDLGGSAILLGASFFKNFIIQIDYPHSLIRILPKKSVDMVKVKNVNVKRQRGTLLPAIEVKVNDDNIWLTLDTGSSGGVTVSRRYAIEKNWITGNEELEQMDMQGVNGVYSAETFNLTNLTIGAYTLENVPVTIPAKGEKSNLGKKSKSTTSGFTRIKKGKQTKGLIGYDVLKHFIVTIDYSSYRVHIVAP